MTKRARAAPACSTPPSAACSISEILPESIPFDYVNKVLNKKALSALIDVCYRKHRNKETVLLADRLRTLGFSFATQGGVSICMDDMMIPPKKKVLIDEAQAEVEKVVDQYQEGLITDGERYNKVVDIWAGVADRGHRRDDERHRSRDRDDPETGEKAEEPSFNPIYIMADSGARGSTQQIRQLAAMRGLMAKPSGEIIETPITANFREGLTRAAVLHLDARRAQGLGRHRAQDGQLRLPHPPPGRRGAGRGRHRVRLRDARRHPRHQARGGRRGHPAARRPHPRPRGARGRRRSAHGRGARRQPTPSSTRPWSARSRTPASRRS